MGMDKCIHHGPLTDNDYYTWKGPKGVPKFACKQCAKDKYKKNYVPVTFKQMLRKDWTGQTYNHLTFIKPTELRHRKAIIWELECTCGKKVNKIPFFVYRGFVKSCGCQTHKLRSDAGAKSRKLEPRISSAKSIWGRVYKDGCNFETFLKLSQLSCTYCGRTPCRTFNKYDGDKRWPKRLDANFTYNGLDRLDNTRDHSPDNVVTCCTNCNMMKQSMSVNNFLNHIKLIYEHQQTLNR